MTNARTNILATFLLLLAVAVSAPAARASDDGLYDKPLDPNSAFVRMVTPGNSSATIMGKPVTLDDSGISAYYPVAPGDISVTTSMGPLTISAVAGKFYSVIPVAGKPASVEDDLNTNPAKATLSAYNLSSSKDVDVFVPQAKVEALKDVGGGTSKYVALKAPLTLDLVVRSDGGDVATIGAVEFKRLSAVSLVVMESGGALRAIALSNKVAR